MLGSPPKTSFLLDKLFELCISVRPMFFHAFITLKVLLWTHSNFSTSVLQYRCCALSLCSSSNHSTLRMKYTPHSSACLFLCNKKRGFALSLIISSNLFFQSTDKSSKLWIDNSPLLWDTVRSISRCRSCYIPCRTLSQIQKPYCFFQLACKQLEACFYSVCQFYFLVFPLIGFYFIILLWLIINHLSSDSM